MAFVLADRVQETTTTTGYGSITLAGAVTGFRSFSSAIGTSNTTYYAIVSASGTEWEVGLGTLSGSTTLDRTTVYSSSNSNSLVGFSAGTKNVFCTMAATQAVTTLSPAFPKFTVATGSSVTAGQAVSFTSGAISPVTLQTVQYTSITSPMVGASTIGNVCTVLSDDTSGNGSFPMCVYYMSGGIYASIGYLGYASSNTYSYDAPSSSTVLLSAIYLGSPYQYSASYDRVSKRVQIHRVDSSGYTYLTDGNVSQTSYSWAGVSSSYSVSGGYYNNFASVYCVNQDVVLAFYIDSSNDLKCLKYYKNSPTDYYSSYVSPVTIGTAGAYASPAGFTLTATYDETNGSAILLVQTRSSGDVNGFAINPQLGLSTPPTVGSLTSVTTAAFQTGPSSAAYLPGYSGCVFAYVPQSTGTAQYLKLTASGTTLTVGSPSNASTSSLGGQCNGVFVETAAVRGGAYGTFGYYTNVAGNSYYYAESFTASGGTLSLYGSTQSIFGGGAIWNPLHMSIVYAPGSSNFNFAYFSANTATNRITYYQSRAASTNLGDLVGIVQQSGSAGSSVSVAIPYQVATVSSGSFSVGSKYYVNSGGTISTSSSSATFIGKALSSTTILVSNAPGLTS